MEKKWIGAEKVVNGVEVHWFEGDAYVDLRDYKKLLEELEGLRNESKSEEKDRSY